MKLKRYISLLLLTVYLFATAGMAVNSMSCHCVAIHLHATHCCCADHHDQHHDLDGAKAGLSAPCCTNHHSTVVELYTGFSADNTKIFRAVVTDLPAALVADKIEAVDFTELFEQVFERRVPHELPGWQPHRALRAPPVLA